MYGPPFTASPGALPLFLASLNKPKARVPYPSRAWEHAFMRGRGFQASQTRASFFLRL